MERSKASTSFFDGEAVARISVRRAAVLLCAASVHRWTHLTCRDPSALRGQPRIASAAFPSRRQHWRTGR